MTGDHHLADMLRKHGATKINLPSLQERPSGDDEFLSAVREAVEGEYDLLGEMGRDDRRIIVYLARDLSSGRLVALKLEQGDSRDEFSLEVVKQLDSSLLTAESSCPRCNAPAQVGWRRYCPQCGADMSGFSSELQSPADLLEAVREAAPDEFEVLGEMDRAEGGGRVYFARDRKSGGIITLRLQRQKDSHGGEEYGLSQTRLLKPLAAELGGSRTAQTPPKIKPPGGPD